MEHLIQTALQHSAELSQIERGTILFMSTFNAMVWSVAGLTYDIKNWHHTSIKQKIEAIALTSGFGAVLAAGIMFARGM